MAISSISILPGRLQGSFHQPSAPRVRKSFSQSDRRRTAPVRIAGLQHLYGLGRAVQRSGQSLYLAPTLYMMQVYDRVVPTGGLTSLALMNLVAMLALATLATLATLDWLRIRLLTRAVLRLDKRLAGAIIPRVIDSPDSVPSAQALREFDAVRSALVGQGALALFDAPWTPLYLACCFLLHPLLGALTLVGGTLFFLLAAHNERDGRPRLNAGGSRTERTSSPAGRASRPNRETPHPGARNRRSRGLDGLYAWRRHSARPDPDGDRSRPGVPAHRGVNHPRRHRQPAAWHGPRGSNFPACGNGSLPPCMAP